MEWSEIVTHAGAFLAGTAVGACGKYFADKFTDQRRLQEQKKIAVKEFRNVQSKMPELIAEMKGDLSKKENQFTREFFVTKKIFTIAIDRPRFFYYYEDHPDLDGKVTVLENYSYVTVVRRENQIYRMSEEFVSLVIFSH